MDLDRMDAGTVMERGEYLIWRLHGCFVEEVEDIHKEPKSVEQEIEIFLSRCKDFAADDDDGTFEGASRIYRLFLAAPCRMAYAERFDPTLRKPETHRR